MNKILEGIKGDLNSLIQSKKNDLKDISKKDLFIKNFPYLLIFFFLNRFFYIYLELGFWQSFKNLNTIFTMDMELFPIGKSLLYSLIGTMALKIAVLYKLKNAKKFRKGEEYGSARWAKSNEIKPFIDLENPDNNIILTKTEVLTMEERLPKRKIAYSRNKNVLVIGGSGSGKTRFFVKPNLMQLHSSYVVTDPKGSLIVETGKMFEDSGYDIKTFNTINFSKSMHYNPFSYVKTEKDILKLVTTIMVNTKGEGEKATEDFWTKAERLLYNALIAYIVFELKEEDRHFGTLIDLIDNSQVKEDDENFKSLVDYIFEELEEKKGNIFSVRQYKKYKLAAGKTAKSILISCGARLAPFDINELREVMSYDELELDKLGGYNENIRIRGKELLEGDKIDIKDKQIYLSKKACLKIKNECSDQYFKVQRLNKKKKVLFIIISDTDDTFNFVVAMLYTQLFNLLCDKADDEFDGRLPNHVRCILDEFANIGQIPKFEKLIATIRSRSISACVILQAQSQLKDIYKEKADTIIGNCDTTLFLGGKEYSTLESLEKVLGKETIELFNTSETRGREKSAGTNYQKLGRSLMSQDEIAVMPGNKCILQIRGARPWYSNKYVLEDHKRFSQTSDYSKKNNFDIKKYMDKINPNKIDPWTKEVTELKESDIEEYFKTLN